MFTEATECRNVVEKKFPSTVFYLLSTVFRLLSTVFCLPSTVYPFNTKH
jgi:hypothetical protein